LLHPNGYSAKIGIQPDMKTLGKYIGGGMSFGAFGGLAEIMDMFDPVRPDALPHAGTFNNNVLTMTVGLAGLTEVFTPEVCVAHCALGEKLKTDLNDMFMRYQAPMQVTGIGTLLNIHMVTGNIVRAEDAKGDVRIERLLYHHLLDDGIYIAERGFIALSILIGEKENALLVSAIERFILQYRSLLVG
jgi:glutamate-1-semialdehyde 2,1-aminomutase